MILGGKGLSKDRVVLGERKPEIWLKINPETWLLEILKPVEIPTQCPGAQTHPYPPRSSQ